MKRSIQKIGPLSIQILCVYIVLMLVPINSYPRNVAKIQHISTESMEKGVDVVSSVYKKSGHEHSKESFKDPQEYSAATKEIVTESLEEESQHRRPKHHSFKKSTWGNSTLGFRKIKFDINENTNAFNATTSQKLSKGFRSSSFETIDGKSDNENAVVPIEGSFNIEGKVEILPQESENRSTNASNDQGICVEGHKRNALHLNLFSQYDVCENASWVERFCPENSLFWNVIQCCIPITEFPSMANCIQADDYSNRTKKSGYRSMTIDEEPVNIKVIILDSKTQLVVPGAHVEYYVENLGRKGNFISKNNLGHQTLNPLSSSDAPNQILYIVKKDNYIEAIDKHTIFEKPLNQTHIIYLDPIEIQAEDNVTASEETTYPIEESTSPQDLTTIPGVVESTNDATNGDISTTISPLGDVTSIENHNCQANSDCETNEQCVQYLCKKTPTEVGRSFDRGFFGTSRSLKKQNPFDVDIVFVMDSTASMGHYIQDVKAHISEMAEDIVDRFLNCTVRVGFVGYRDFTEGEKRLETLNLTNQTDEFIEFVGKIKAYAGGDVPEDVLGGLNQALDLSWAAKNRIIFHIGDAPPRGTKYCLNKIWCRKENKNDLNGPQPKDIISRMKENGIIYNILMINDKIKPMVNVFKSAEGNGSWRAMNQDTMIRTFEMVGGLEFDMITKAVIDQIKEAVEEDGKPDIDDKGPKIRY